MRYALPLLLGFCATTTLAHDVWISREGANYTLYQGHTYSAHAGAEMVPYDPAMVKSVVCQQASGSIKQMAFAKTHPVKWSGECAAMMVSLSSGYWTKTAWETRNVPKTGMSGVIKSWQSKEAIKRIDRWTRASSRPIGKGLEITPQGDPFKLGINDKLTVLVTENGKPMVNVPVAYHGETRGVSGADGTVSLRIRHRGVNLISASLETPLADGRADMLVNTTSLQFELPK